mgnify:CR=1 FL=1
MWRGTTAAAAGQRVDCHTIELRAQRLHLLPDVPTFAEQGMKDFDVPAWYGFVAPVGTPADAIQWLNTEVNSVLKDPSVIAKLDDIGALPVGGTPAQMGSFIQAQSARWGKVKASPLTLFHTTATKRARSPALKTPPRSVKTLDPTTNSILERELLIRPLALAIQEAARPLPPVSDSL